MTYNLVPFGTMKDLHQRVGDFGMEFNVPYTKLVFMCGEVKKSSTYRVVKVT